MSLQAFEKLTTAVQNDVIEQIMGVSIYNCA